MLITNTIFPVSPLIFTSLSILTTKIDKPSSNYKQSMLFSRKLAEKLFSTYTSHPELFIDNSNEYQIQEAIKHSMERLKAETDIYNRSCLSMSLLNRELGCL